jgi:uncharacterized protein
MTVVVDTNVLLPVLAVRHPFGVIFDAWIAGRFTWALSTEILFEYEEILPPRLGLRRWDELMTLLEIVPSAHSNLRRVSPSFRWRLITADPDDDKFADCAIAAEAEWIVTEDGHFTALATSAYKPKPITPAEFIARFLTP